MVELNQKSYVTKIFFAFIISFLFTYGYLQFETNQVSNSAVQQKNLRNSLFSEKFVGSQHETNGPPAYFPLSVDDRNCFNALSQPSTLPECSFDVEKCLTDTRNFVPDFDLAPWDLRELKYSTIHHGSWAPCNCRPNSTLAIIIPFRFRAFHLNVFTNNIIPFLQHQRQAFTIFVVEHTHGVAFNRGASFNAAYKEIQNLPQKYDCYIIHDVDMVNENLCNYYKCGTNPRHLSVAVEKMGYDIYYKEYSGGIMALSEDILLKINGFSNNYFGWGGEDDNLYGRLYANNYTLDRYTKDIGRYASLTHERSEAVEGRTRNAAWKQWPFYKVDGLSSLQYTVKEIKKSTLFTYILVHILGPGDNAKAIKAYDRMTIYRFSEDYPDLYQLSLKNNITISPIVGRNNTIYVQPGQSRKFTKRVKLHELLKT